MHVRAFDLIVIGAGPAGSCAAAFARQRGMSVCLIEKQTFPRFRIGESLLPAGNAVLQATGVWEKLESAGFIHKHGARFQLPDGSRVKRIDFSRGCVPDLGRTFQVERARFDQILLEHAHSLGTIVRTPARVTAVAAHSDHVSVEVSDETDGSTTTLSARWLIDAGGRESQYATETKRTLDPARFPKRIAVYSHFRGLPRDPGKEGGDTIVVRLADGWFWIIPIDAERTSVGLVTTVESMRAGGGEPAALFARTVEEAPWLRRVFAHATRTMEFHVTADYSYFRRELAAERIVFAGDAGGFFDPIFSSGVTMAMFSAQRAVEAIVRAHAGGRALTLRERARYTRRVKKHAGVFARMIETFYDNDSFAIFLSPKPPFDLERGLTSIVAGHARLSWALWWRFTLFLTVCRINKRRHFAPPIHIPVSVASPCADDGAALSA